MVGREGRRVALVSGGASGIGRAVARRLAGEGITVAVLDIDGEGAAATAAGCRADGGSALAVSADVRCSEAVAEAVGRVRAGAGPISIAVTCAGVASRQAFAELDEESWLGMIDVHLHGTYRVLRACVPDMLERGWGRIVTVASVAGLSGTPGFAHYAAAKGGIIALTKSLALEVGRRGVTANVVAPGLIDTPMPRRSGLDDAALARIAAGSALGRLGTPEEVAAVCAFLASDDAGFVTGQVISPNGGQFT